MAATVNFKDINLDYASRGNAILNEEKRAFGLSTHQRTNTIISLKGNGNILLENSNFSFEQDYGVWARTNDFHTQMIHTI